MIIDDDGTPGERLVQAVIGRDLDGIRDILDAGFDVDTPVHKRGGHTALHKAVMLGEREVVGFLIENGADVNLPMDSGGTTSLHWAANSGHVEISTLLLDAGADTEALNVDGLTPAGVARCRGYPFLGNLLAGEDLGMAKPDAVDNVVSFRPRL